MIRSSPRSGRTGRLREPVSPAVILVVDDSEVVARVVTRFLGHLGYSVIEAASGEEAQAIVQRREPPIDLVLCDTVLGAAGGMDGWTFATALLAECPAPQLLMVTRTLPAPIESLHQGCRIGVLRKPLDLDELHDLLRVLLPNLPPAEECDPGSPLAESSWHCPSSSRVLTPEAHHNDST